MAYIHVNIAHRGAPFAAFRRLQLSANAPRFFFSRLTDPECCVSKKRDVQWERDSFVYRRQNRYPFEGFQDFDPLYLNEPIPGTPYKVLDYKRLVDRLVRIFDRKVKSRQPFLLKFRQIVQLCSLAYIEEVNVFSKILFLASCMF